mmetsp:Transcript_152669/g.277608  ORF Transcript_152669/g.277608 Transcript_152669/m.277608 type:complete len:104 (+) Transcript_152669:131-442(+)
MCHHWKTGMTLLCLTPKLPLCPRLRLRVKVIATLMIVMVIATLMIVRIQIVITKAMTIPMNTVMMKTALMKVMAILMNILMNTGMTKIVLSATQLHHRTSDLA